jgi:hypothetical protein
MITLGCDPEFPVVENGTCYPAKMAMQKAGLETNLAIGCGRFFPDGAALELNVQPAETPTDMVENLSEMFGYMHELEQVLEKPVEMLPSTPFDLDWCKIDERAAIFGCDPDLSVWGRDQDPSNMDASQHPYRYFGGHIHLGAPFQEKPIKALDYTVGLLDTYLSGEEGIKRAGVYGKPGIYRRQPFGVEYRTPSNVYYRAPQTTKLVFKLAQECYNEDTYDIIAEYIPQEVLINTLVTREPNQVKEVLQMVAKLVGFEIPTRPKGNWRENWSL